jgi:hypothetical protein
MPDQRGEGAVYRAIAGVWREHFDPPLHTDPPAPERQKRAPRASLLVLDETRPRPPGGWR